MRSPGLLYLMSLFAVPFGFAGAPEASANAPSSPVLGFVVQHDPLRLQPVIGAAGAAVLGAQIALPDGIAQLTLSPKQTFALAETSDGQSLAVLTIGANGVGSLLPISGAFSHADRIDFSPSGSVASFYSAALQRVQIVSNLPGAAQVASEFDLGSTQAPVTALAVNDDGITVLVGTSDGQTGGVGRISSSGGSARITSASVPAAIRWIANTDNAVVVDSQNNQVTLLEGVSGTPTFTLLAGPADGVSSPSQIEILGGDAFALLGGSASSLLLIDLQAGGVTALPAASPFTGIAPLASGSEAVLSNGSPGSFWLFGRSSGGNRLSFLADAAQVLQ